jgi:membrane protein
MKFPKALARWAFAGILAGVLFERYKDKVNFEFDAQERGRYAETPVEMTALGWRDIFARTLAETFADRLFSVAASVAFFALMSLAPALSVLVSVFGLVADPHNLAARLDGLLELLPQAARELVVEQAVRLTAQPSGVISVKLLVSLALAIWSANAAIKALFDALNVIYDETEKRSFLRLNFISLFVTFSAAIFMAFAISAITLAPIALNFLPFASKLTFAIQYLRWPAFYTIAVVAIAILYWIGPSRARPRFVWVLPGAALAAAFWALVSWAFSFYVANFANYQATYGSLAAVIIFMTWLWASSIVILLGAELNSELERQTARDTTRGPKKPRGARGATVADQIGRAVAQK